jgi:hypothetical protein
MGLPAFAFSESYAANDNDRGPSSTDPCRWHMLITGWEGLGFRDLANHARESKLRGEAFDDYAAMARDTFEYLNELDRMKVSWRRSRAKKLTIKRRRQAAKRAKKGRAA